MNRDTLTIDGCQYHPSPEQRRLIDLAAADRDEQFERIESEYSGQCNTLDNKSDPYAKPILEYQTRVREILGVAN